MRPKPLWLLVLSLGLVLVAIPAWAQEEDEPEDPGTGSVHVKLSGATFAIPFQDETRWDAHIFSPDGAKLIIETVPRSSAQTFELRPADPAFAPTTVTATPKCWKLKKIKKGLREWRCSLRAKFKRDPDAGKPKPEESEPEETDEPDVPPMPGVPPPPPPKPIDEEDE